MESALSKFWLSVLSLLFGPCVKVHEDRNRTTNFFCINILDHMGQVEPTSLGLSVRLFKDAKGNHTVIAQTEFIILP